MRAPFSAANHTFVPPSAGGEQVPVGLGAGGTLGNAPTQQTAYFRNSLGDSLGFQGGAGGGAQPSVEAKDVDNSALWVVPVVSDDNGDATVKVTLPQSSGQWRILSKGCTKDTLVGQAEAKLITRKEFFVDVRLPDLLQEGDDLALLATIHNLTEYKGEARATLRIEGGDSPFEAEKTVDISAEGASEFVFDRFKVPFVSVLRVTVEAKAGAHSDKIVREVLVRPWGLEYADELGGVTSGIAGAQLTLPDGQAYSQRRLVIALSPSIEQALIDLAMQRTLELAPLGRGLSCAIYPQSETLGSSLLAAVSALNYARDRNAGDLEIAQLSERVKSLAASLTVTQADAGSWSWNNVKENSDIVATATAYWALVQVRDAGIAVERNVLEKAERFFQSMFPKLAANDSEGKAVLVHALSVAGKADFSMANRLYRERASLSESALAYLAAAFVRMDRDTFARELLQILQTKAVREQRASQALASWKGAGAHTLLRDRLDVSAMVLWCYARLQRDSQTAAAAADFLLSQAGTRGRSSNRALGSIVAALTEYYAKGERPGDDFEIDVTVNGDRVGTVASSQLRRTRYFSVATDKINAGENSVRLEVKGRGEIRYLASLAGFSAEMNDPESFSSPYFHSRNYYHDRLSYRDVPLNASSTSPVKELNLGQRFRAHVRIYNRYSHDRYLLLEEKIPAGALLVEGSVRGNFDRLQRRGSSLLLSYKPGRVGDLHYEMVAHAPGHYRILPGVLRDASDRGQMRVGKTAELTILDPLGKSGDRYQMNRTEHFELASKLFSDGKNVEAENHLNVLFENKEYRKHHERDVARMLLWILTEREKLAAQKIVDMFEILRERHPDLVIPFDKILRVGEAYREIGEFERAWLVFRATIDSSFLNDAHVSAILEDQGEFLGSIDYQRDLWREYPDGADAVSAYIAMAQALYDKAPQAESLKCPTDVEKLKPEDLYQRSKEVFSSFLTYYPNDPLADDAAFSLTNAYFSLKDYSGVVDNAEIFSERYSDSKLLTSFQYMAALGHFWQFHYDDALKAAALVADGESDDRDYARYITAQIYHARGNPADALTWYEKVKSVYPDAADSIAYFEQKRVSVPEVTTFKPGEKVKLKLQHRNIKEAALLVYKVDLMKLYLREKSLTNITKVNLAGIEPETVKLIELGDGRDFRKLEREVELPIDEEGAYLTICRGDDLFTSGLVLVTPLKLDIQEDAAAGSIRVNVLDEKAGGYVTGAEVKAIGSHMNDFVGGSTGPRGVFQTDGVSGAATVIARHGDSQYAFYRGSLALGNVAQPNQQAEPSNGKQQVQKKLDYLDNVKLRNRRVISEGLNLWDSQRRSGGKGVEVQKAR